MSNVIDQRVVEMRFDNKQFESNVATSMSTLQKLKQSLNFKSASKGFDEINGAAKRLDMSALGRGVEAVGAKFSALEVMGVTALMNITNSAVNAGKRMVSALTIDPIKTGFQEYETKINAVQTILSNTASKGTTMSDVTRVINELNTYADKTIYNFSEMTRNIGTFTAAGVGLEDSAAAIQGIANLAAASGSSSQQASTAMYQLSQALSSGTVKLQDWNSVVNAGMGGTKFQEALKTTARDHGVAIDAIIEKQGSFRESLQTGWITADILNETLRKFTVEGAKDYAKSMMESGKWTQEQADALIKEAQSMEDAATKVKTFTQLWDTLKESAQSGWGQTWEIIVGDFEKAKSRLTQVSDLLGGAIGESADRRNDLLENALTSKYDIIIKRLNSAGIEAEGFQDKIKELSGTHKEEFQKMIDESDTFEEAVRKALDAKIIDKAGIKQALKDVTGEVVKLSDEELKNKGYTEEQIASLRALSDEANKTGSSIDDLINNITKPSGAELIWDAFLNVLKTILAPMDAIRKAKDEIFPPNPEGIYNTIKAIKEFTDRLLEAVTASKTLETITEIFKGIFSAIDIGWMAIKSVVKGIIDIGKNLIKSFGGFGEVLLGLITSFSKYITGLRDSIKQTDIFGNAVNRVVAFVNKFINKVAELGKIVGNKFGEIGSAIRAAVDIPDVSGFMSLMVAVGKFVGGVGSKLFETLSPIGATLMEIFRNLDFTKVIQMLNQGLFAGLLVSVTKFVKGITKQVDEGLGFVETLKDFKSSITDTLNSVRDSLQAYQDSLKADTLMKIAKAVGLMAVSLFLLSTIEEEDIDNSLGAMAGILIELFAAMAALDKINSKNVGKGLSGLVGTLNSISKSLSMIGLAGAVLILAATMKILSTIDADGMQRGLDAIFLLITMLVAAAKIMDSNYKSITKFSGQMRGMTIAVGILALVAKLMASMSWDEVDRATTGIFGMITMLVAAAKIMDSEDKAVTKFSGQMIGMAVAVGILTFVAKAIASMSWEEINKATTGIFGMITMLVAAAKIMDSEDKAVTKFSGQMIGMAVAVGILTFVAKAIASMSWEEINKATTGIFGMITMLVAAAKIMDSDRGSVAKFAGQMILMAIALAILTPILKTLGEMDPFALANALMAIGAALAIMAIGLCTMDGTLKGSAALIVAAIALAILTPALVTLGNLSLGSIVKALLTLAGSFVILGIAGAVLGPLIPAILGLAGAFALVGIAALAIGAGLALVGIGLTSIAAAGTAAAASLVASLGIIISGLIGLIPTIIDGLSDAILAFCELIGNVAPQVAEAALQLISSVLDSLNEHLPDIVESIFTIIIQLLDILAEKIPDLLDSLVPLIISLIDGLALYIPQILESISNLLVALIQGVAEILGPIVEALVGPLFESIKSLIVGVIEAIGPYLPTISEFFTSMTEIISNAIVRIIEILAPFMPNIQAIVESVSQAVQSICAAFTALIENLSPIIDSISSLVQSLGTAISDILYAISDVISTTGTTICDIFNEIEEVISTTCTGITDVLGGLAETFDSAFGGISEVIESVGTSIKSVLDGIAGVIESIGQAALDAGTGFDKLADGVVKITDTNLADMASSLGAVAIGVGDIAANSSGFSEVGEGMRSIADSMNMSASSFVIMDVGLRTILSTLTSIGPTATISMSMLRTAVLSSVSSFTTFGASVSLAFGTMMNSIITTIMSRQGMFVTAGLGLMSALASGIVLGVSRIPVVVSSVMSSVFVSIVSRQAMFTMAGISLIVALGAGFMAGKNIVIASVFSMLSAMTAAIMERQSIFGMAAIALMTGFVMGMRTQMPMVIVTIIQILNQIMLLMRSRAVDFKMVGIHLMINLASGIRTQVATIRKAVSTALSGAIAGIRLYYSNFKDAGKYLGQGLIDGMNAKQQAAYNAGHALGKISARGVKDGAQEKSPSKLTTQYGEYLGEGLVIGMGNTLGAVYKQGKELGKGAATSVYNAINGAADAANVDYTPSIRPVVDLTNFRQDTGNLTIGADISSRLLSGPVNSLQNIVANAQSDITASNNEVIKAINGLRDDLNMYYSSDDKEIALYMDTKKVASTIAKPMNRELNILAKRGAY